jgi:hypothetical protein
VIRGKSHGGDYVNSISQTRRHRKNFFINRVLTVMRLPFKRRAAKTQRSKGCESQRRGRVP